MEDETLSCGTGVTAVAIAMHSGATKVSQCTDIETKGGKLECEFKVRDSSYIEISLELDRQNRFLKVEIEW